MGCTPSSNAVCATAVNSLGWNDGLIYYDPHSTSGDTSLYVTKRYWALRHFSYFIRPGATRFTVVKPPSGVVAIATLNRDVWHGLFINEQKKPADFDLTFPGMHGIITNIVQTTAQDDWVNAPVPPADATSKPVSLTRPAQNLFSIQFTVSGNPSHQSERLAEQQD